MAQMDSYLRASRFKVADGLQSGWNSLGFAACATSGRLYGSAQWSGAGYTPTVPYSIDLTAAFYEFGEGRLYGGFAGSGSGGYYNGQLASVTIFNVWAWGKYDSGAGVYRMSGKRWNQAITYAASGATPFVLNGAANNYAYNSDATNWAVGTGNAGFARLIVSGNSLLLNFYGTTSPAAASTTRVGYQIDYFGQFFT